MIDARQMPDDKRIYLATFLSELLSGLRIERRCSTVVRVEIGADLIDFRVTYLGPSRPRRKARRPG